MKILKLGIAAASLLLASAQALAFTPPFHIALNPYTGTATIQSSGSCIVKRTFVGAQQGRIDDVNNNQVGYGIVADGDILALEVDYEQVYDFKDSKTENEIQSYYEDMASDETIAAIESFSKGLGCSIKVMVSSIKSRETYTITPSKNLDQYTLQYPFSGITHYEPTVVKGTKTYKKTKNFSGKITFKGDRPLG